MNNKMPEWLRNFIIAASLDPSQSLELFGTRLYEEIKKPENLAEIPEIMALILALNHYKQTQAITKYLAVFSNFKNNYIAKEALKPFEKENSGE